ncbi:hypothetical protein ABUV39_000136 [Vibrio cholerae]
MLSDEVIQSMKNLIEYRIGNREDSKEFNSILNFEREAQHKSHYKCNHIMCRKPSIDSHELSRKIVLEGLSNNKKEVFFLIPDFAGNSFRYTFKPRSIEGATTFPGFCEGHDNDLFLSMEDEFSGVNSDYVHRQTLRTLRKEIYKKKLHITKLVRTLRKDKSSSKNEKWRYIFGRILETRGILNSYRCFYRRLWHAITLKSKFLHYKVIEVKNKGVAFSGMYDLSEEGQHVDSYVFVYLIPIGNLSYFIMASLDDKDTVGLVDEIFPKGSGDKFFVQSMILEKKEDIVFSEDFIRSNQIPSALFDHSEIVNHGIFPCVELF